MSISRLLSILAALALMIAPVAMQGGGAAMAGNMPQTAMGMDHCSGMDGEHGKQQPVASHDCVMTCSAIASADALVIEKPVSGLVTYHALPLPAFHGIEPAAETPPPRFS